MTDKQPEALRLANVCSNLTRYSMDAHLIAAYLRSQHAELETLRTGYAAARLEIESLKAQLAERASHGQAPAGAGEPFGYFHQLLNHEGKGNGVWLGAAERKVVEQAHMPGETSEEIVALYTTPQPTQAQAAEGVTAPGGGVVAGRFMDEAAERRSAQEGYENRIKRVSERNPHDEGMYSLGWWDRAWKAAAPGAIHPSAAQHAVGRQDRRCPCGTGGQEP